MKREQQHIFDTLESRQIAFEPIDVASSNSTTLKEMLRAGPKGLKLPQIWIDGHFKASYAEFEEALENETLQDLLVSRQVLEEPLH